MKGRVQRSNPHDWRLTKNQTYRPIKMRQTDSAQETKLIRLLCDFSDQGNILTMVMKKEEEQEDEVVIQTTWSTHRWETTLTLIVSRTPRDGIGTGWISQDELLKQAKKLSVSIQNKFLRALGFVYVYYEVIIIKEKAKFGWFIFSRIKIGRRPRVKHVTLKLWWVEKSIKLLSKHPVCVT